MSRYISDSQIKKELEFAVEHNQGVIKNCYKRALNLVNIQPTAEVKSIIPGEWMNYFKDEKHPYHDFLLFCSNCNELYVIADEMSKWNFCPNCGADMRKESKE